MLQPQPPFRSISTTSNLSISSSSTSITRVALGPLAMNINFNQQSTPQDHLHHQSLILKNKLAKVEGMEPFLNLAFNSAEHCAEQQALALSQQMLQENSRSANDYRISVGSAGFSIHSDTSSSSNVGNNTFNSGNKTLINNNIFTYTAGVLPANISVDPATQLWKLFQQGAPLCLLFNAVVSTYQIPIVGSDDMRICKKSVYDFLIAVKTHLNFSDDIMFTISNVFSDSTQDFLKVVKVVDKLLGLQKLEATFNIDLLAEPAPVGEVLITDERSKVFKEMIETERKYVKDLELLLSYKNELEEADLLSNEQVHVLFPNLSEIIDFQRRFLNGLECNINVPNKYQRIGSVFIHASTGPFKAYEPWTIGQLSAIDLITKEASNLKKSSSLLDPGFELQSYILKPIQRLCKYPLLLKELIKNTQENNDSNTHSASYNELIIACNAMKDMANEVNEAQRRAENVEFLQQLIGRVSNWRGFNLRDQGELLLHGPVSVRDAENEKDYIAYLFDRIVFFFVELEKPTDSTKEKEPKKKREILSTRKKSSASVNSSTINLLEAINKSKADKTSPLELKGRVYISEIYNISSNNNNGYTLVISWSGKKESGSFTLRYRTEEIRNQWENCLRNLKSVEMNSQIQRRYRDSQGSQLTNESSFYDVTAAYTNISPNTPGAAAGGASNTVNTDAISLRSSSGSSYQRHHSSSSTFSMMRQSRGKSGESQGRTSSQNGMLFSANTPMTPNIESFLNNISISLVYNSSEISEPLVVSSNIQYGELYLKISAQIVGSDAVKDDILVNKLKYKDEDGDFVVMDSNDDWILAVDMLEEIGGDSADSTRELTIWVS